MYGACQDGWLSEGPLVCIALQGWCLEPYRQVLDIGCRGLDLRELGLVGGGEGGNL